MRLSGSPLPSGGQVEVGFVDARLLKGIGPENDDRHDPG
jgi:hypothetical protein